MFVLTGRVRTHVRTCEDGSESVGVCCPAFAPCLNWLPCILPKHLWFSVHMYVCPFPIRKLGHNIIVRTQHFWLLADIAVAILAVDLAVEAVV
jgi:hypothetical protein